MSARRRVVICAGNRYRGDDAVGLEIAARLRREIAPEHDLLTLEGEPTTLLDRFDSAELLILVDAVAGAGAAGAIHRFDASREQLPRSVFGASTHAFGLGETIELARVLGRLHGRVLVYGITGENFGAGEGLSPSVAAAAAEVTREILANLREPIPPVPEIQGANRA